MFLSMISVGYFCLGAYVLSVYVFTPADNNRIKQERVFGQSPSSVAIKTTNIYSVRKIRLCVKPCKQKNCSERRANTPVRFFFFFFFFFCCIAMAP